jgi:hypothetical protein
MQPIGRFCYFASKRFVTLPARHAMKRVRGFECANFYLRDFARHSSSVAALKQIVDRLPGAPKKWNVVIDQGCGEGFKVKALRNFADSVWGIDILPGVAPHVDRYFCVDPNDVSCTKQIGDAQVDVIFVINYAGFSSHSTWRACLSEHNDRLAHYMLPQNFPRIIPKGGYLIFNEWEARPEERWGKTPLDEIDRRAAEEYDPPTLSGFELVACGFARATRSPFVAYRRI